jgi:hypothetical protein
MNEKYERYEIILPTDKISDLEENAIDGHICFTATDNEVTEVGGKWVKD